MDYTGCVGTASAKHKCIAAGTYSVSRQGPVPGPFLRLFQDGQ